MTTKKNLIKEVLWHRKERVQQLGREAELKRRAEQAEDGLKAHLDQDYMAQVGDLSQMLTDAEARAEQAEADTIREALAPMGPSRRARIDAALTALERRAEQAERKVGGLDVLYREVQAQRDKAEAERDREARRKEFERGEHYQAVAERDALNAVLLDITDRSDWPVVGAAETLREVTRRALAATTPGEPRPLAEHDHEGTPHMGHAFAAHDGFPAHQHIGTVPFARATPGETCPTCGSDDPEYDIASHVAPGMRLSHVMLNYPCPDDFHIEKCPNACEDEEFVHTVSTGNGGRSVCMWPGHNQSSTADLDRADHDGRKP